MQIRPQDATP